jgi:hypothetical protein
VEGLALAQFERCTFGSPLAVTSVMSSSGVGIGSSASAWFEDCTFLAPPDKDQQASAPTLAGSSLWWSVA